jgi:hypothetical protein
MRRDNLNGWRSSSAVSSHKGPWAISNMKPLKIAVAKRYLTEYRFRSLSGQYHALGMATCTEVYGPVAGAVRG